MRLLLSILLLATAAWATAPVKAATPESATVHQSRDSAGGEAATSTPPQRNESVRRRPIPAREERTGGGPPWWILAVVAVIGAPLLYRHFQLARINRRLVAARDEADEGNRAKRRFFANVSGELNDHLNRVLNLAVRARNHKGVERVQGSLRGIESSALSLRAIFARAGEICSGRGSEAGPLDEGPANRLSDIDRDAVTAQDGPRETIFQDGSSQERGNAPALDGDVGLGWAGGDAGLYRELLEEFHRVYKGKLGLLVATTSFEQTEEIKRFAHALKSSAAMIGAEPLAHAATELDAEIQRDGRPNVRRISELRARLATVIRVLDERLSAESGNATEDVSGTPQRDDGRAAVLVVDDEPVNFLLIREFISPEHRVDYVKSGEQALHLSSGESQPDLILLDVVMPRMDGFEVCRRLKASPWTRDIPVVFITGKTDPLDEQRGLDLGAVDYIHKPFKRAVLEARVRTHIALKRQGDLLAELSGTDALTGIANRRRLDEVLRREWNNAIRNRRSLAFMMIDIDEFKAFNDRYGHDAGDECLARLGWTMELLCRRKTDLVARYGGEEFSWIMPDTDIGGAKRKARDLLEAIRDLRIPHAASSVCEYVTASIGVWAEVPRHDESPRAFVKRADERLYQAKRGGRNRVAGG